MIEFFPQHFYPRSPLTIRERRRLEHQFSDEVPEFSTFYDKKLKHEKMAWTSSALVGGLALIPGLRTKNVIGALAIGALGVVLTHLSFKTPAMRSLFGMTEYNEKECIRAFNLWVYYTQERNHVVDKMQKETEERYSTQLQAFKDQYTRSQYDPKTQ